MSNFSVLFGINKYAMPGNDLRGCIPDVKDVWELLNERKYTPEGNRVLIDERATKEAMLARLNWLSTVAGAGDNVVYYHSGHGSQIRDRSGDELKDHMDELLIPYDLDPNWTKILIDDEIHMMFKRLHPEATLVCIVDACHSGSVTRDLVFGNPRQLTMRYIEPPFDLQARSLKVEKKIGKKRFGGKQPKNTVEPLAIVEEQNHILLSGCQDYQTSAETNFGGTHRGAMTYFLTKIIREKKPGSWIEAHEILLQYLKKDGFDQVPRLSGPKRLLERVPFGE